MTRARGVRDGVDPEIGRLTFLVLGAGQGHISKGGKSLPSRKTNRSPACASCLACRASGPVCTSLRAGDGDGGQPRHTTAVPRRRWRRIKDNTMPTRMQSRNVTFRRPFVLDGFDRVEPAGTYTVDTEEETIDDVSFAVWKRCATVMHIVRDGATEYVRIDPEDLLKALSRDE